MGKKYQNKEWLRSQYVEKAKPMEEISEICDCSASTISRWIDEHDLPRRSRSESLRRARGTHDGEFNKKKWLRKQYIEKKRSAIDIADECDVHVDTIYKRLEEFDIERRSIKEATGISDTIGFEGREHPAWHEHVTFYTHGRDNYEVWQHNWEGEQTSVFVHRLLAVAEYGLDALEDKQVHHKNGIKWDNRPENIELLSSSEHTKLHHERGDYPQSAE